MSITDPTFRSYKPEQAQNYAKGRPPYPDSIFNLIYDHHAKTGGKFGRVVDVGCGPGIATKSVALAFDEAFGLDPGDSMINTARSIGGKTKSGKDIQYEVCAAEAIDELDCLEPGSVDMLTSAMAVHWFDLNEFWPRAARLLKPGGTVAVWTTASLYCHPAFPNYEEIQRIANRLEHEDLGPYEMKGNRLSKDMYDDLELPWQISKPVEEFPESLYVKHEFNRNGAVPEGEDFFTGSENVTLERLEIGLDTASMATRWRAAHPELAGTDQDCVKRAIRDLKAALGDRDGFPVGKGTAILLFKKKS